MVQLARDEIEIRIKRMDASNRMEGISVNPEYRKFTNELRNKGYSSKEILIKFIEKVKK